MRWLLPLLIVALAAVTIWSVVETQPFLFGASAPGEGWFPAEVAVGGEHVDGLFRTINFVLLVLLVGTFAVLAWVVWRGAGRRSNQGTASEGNTSLELVWTIVPAAVLLWLTWLQLQVRDDMVTSTSMIDPVVVRVDAAQYEWRFRYAGGDGRIGTTDDVVQVGELVVPTGRTIELWTESRDVVHSFFVPALRLKRDVLPGISLPLRFAVDPEDLARALAEDAFGVDPDGGLELRCAELCGWGHYAMVGRVLPLSPADFDSWLAERGAQRMETD